MKRLLHIALLLLTAATVPTCASAQWITVTANNIQSGSGAKLANGQLCVQPVDNNNRPLISRAGGSGGAIVTSQSCGTVTAGVLQSGFQMPDTSLTFPTNTCFRVTIKDLSQNGIAVYTSSCVQPSSASAQSYWCSTSSGTTTCNFDLYNPSVATQTVAAYGPQGPAGTVGIGTITPLSSGSTPTVTNSGTSSAAILNFGLPVAATGATGATGTTGPAGPTGPTGPVGPSLTFEGAWSGSTPYTVGQSSSLNGYIYAVLTSNTGTSPTGTCSSNSVWQLVSVCNTTLSTITFTETDTTIKASWTTNVAGDSTINCGGRAGADAGAQTNVTSHIAAVAGLSPQSAYQCYVSTNGTSSAPQSVVTTASPARYQIMTASLGSVTTATAVGDTYYNCEDASGSNYLGIDDSTTPSNSDFALLKITNTSTMAVSLVNAMSAYGGEGDITGNDGPGNVALDYKQAGLFCMGGVKYFFTSRGAYTGGLQPQWYGNIIADDANNGASWNNHQAPNTYNANGSPDGPGVTMFTDPYNAAGCSPIRYAPDDGTLGYNTPGNGIDGADVYVYEVCPQGVWDNGNALYVRRIPRAKLALLAGDPAWEWWAPPASLTSPTPADSQNAANWSTNGSLKQPILVSANQLGWSNISFVRGMNSYSIETWYYTPGNYSTHTVWKFYSALSFVGPWTLYFTQDNPTTAWYNPVPLHSQIAANSSNASATYDLLFAGNYTNSTYYKLNFAPLTVLSSQGTITVPPASANGTLAAPPGPSYAVVGAGCGSGCTNGVMATPTNGPNGPPAVKMTVLAGSSLVAIIAIDGPATMSNVSDLAGCTWSQVGTPQASTYLNSGGAYYTWVGTGCSATVADVVTFTMSANTLYSNALVWQLTDGAGMTYDTAAFAHAASVASLSTSTFNTAYSKEAVLVMCNPATTEGIAPTAMSSGYTLDTVSVAPAATQGGGHQVFFAPQTGITAGCTYAATHNLEVFAVALGHN